MKRVCSPKDLEDFVDFRIAREKRFPGAHLGEDAAHGPHVDASGVLAASEKDLRGAVPQRDDLGGEVSMAVTAWRYAGS